MEQRKKRKRRHNFKVEIFRLIFSIFMICITVFFVYNISMFTYNYAKDTAQKSKDTTGEDVEVNIPEGSTTRDIAEILQNNGVISSTIMFRVESRLNDYDGSFKQGRYILNTGMSNEDIMEKLKSGKTSNENSKITIPEGYTVEQIASLVEEKGIATADEFKKEVNEGEFEYSFLRNVPARENALEGYLFPDTYFIDSEETAHDLIVKMLNRFNNIYNDEYQSKVESSEYTLDQIITIASLIESEIRIPEEREIASGVIYNRLNQDMPLQIDSTVLYAKNLKKEVVTYDDLEIDSPYNTYKNKGLPIGPICNPGEAAIKAAIYPQTNNYLFYVLRDRTSGQHVYTETYDEFLKAKEQYKAEFD